MLLVILGLRVLQSFRPTNRLLSSLPLLRRLRWKIIQPVVDNLSPTAFFGFLEHDYRYKSVATNIRQIATLEPIRPAGIKVWTAASGGQKSSYR